MARWQITDAHCAIYVEVLRLACAERNATQDVHGFEQTAFRALSEYMSAEPGPESDARYNDAQAAISALRAGVARRHEALTALLRARSTPAAQELLQMTREMAESERNAGT